MAFLLYCPSWVQESLLVLKKVLTDIIPILMAKKPKVLYSEMCTAHWVVCDPQPAGLTMRQMSVEEDKLCSICPLLEEDVKNLKIGFDEKVYTCILMHTHAYAMQGHSSTFNRCGVGRTNNYGQNNI